jgi:hypothetical protein
MIVAQRSSTYKDAEIGDLGHFLPPTYQFYLVNLSDNGLGAPEIVAVRNEIQIRPLFTGELALGCIAAKLPERQSLAFPRTGPAA